MRRHQLDEASAGAVEASPASQSILRILGIEMVSPLYVISRGA
jgi:hypothetical protein